MVCTTFLVTVISLHRLSAVFSNIPDLRINLNRKSPLTLIVQGAFFQMAIIPKKNWSGGIGILWKVLAKCAPLVRELNFHCEAKKGEQLKFGKLSLL